MVEMLEELKLEPVTQEWDGNGSPLDFVLSKNLHRPKPLPMPRRLFGLVAPYGAIAFGDTWLPLSNAKAKAELGWTPIPR